MSSPLRLPALIVLGVALAPGQTVTATQKIRIDGRIETARKINGRWWAEDNRELTPPKIKGEFWYLSSKKGKGWAFHHHRPVNLPMAESLHLFMDPASVEALLGSPNFSAGQEAMGSLMWMYYAENGTALLVTFTRNELAIAQYQRSDFGVAGKPVQSVADDLGGRDIFKVMADRAWQRRSPAAYAKYRGQSAPAVIEAPAPAAPPKPPQRIAANLVDSLKVGMSRPEVVHILGEPHGGMHIEGAENDAETLTYSLEPTGQVSLQLEKGKLVRIAR